MYIVSSKPTITRKELESVLDCLIDERLSTGTTVRDFELKISAQIQIKYPEELVPTIMSYTQVNARGSFYIDVGNIDCLLTVVEDPNHNHISNDQSRQFLEISFVREENRQLTTYSY